jgi:ligand-binding SRPBCC domain-containing protein
VIDPHPNGRRFVRGRRQDRSVPSTFTLVTDASISAQALFDLSLDIDAHISSMSQSAERAVGGVMTGQIGLGETVTWRARHFGVWWTMTSQITDLDRPTRFIDQQVRGPFKMFVHEHRFEQLTTGSRMIDTITVASPIFGSLAERLVLVPYLRRLIVKRNEHLLAALR